MIRRSLTLGWLATCNAALAILMPWYVVTRLGVGVETDALFAAGAVPQLVFIVVSTSLAQVLVPLLATEDEETFRKDAWGFFLGIGGLFTLIGLVLYATAGFWVSWLVPGFSDEGKRLAISLTRIQLVSTVLITGVVVLWSVHHARQKFVWAELSPVLANAVALGFLVWALPTYGIVAAAWATVVHNGLKLVLLLPILGRWQRPDWGSPATREFWRRIRPFIFAQTYYRTDPLIDRYLTSLAPAGNLSMFYIAQQVYGAAHQVINKAISSPMMPLLAIAAKAGDTSAYRRIYRERLLWMTALTGAGFLSLLLFGETLLRLTIGHGGITAENVRTLWWTLVALTGVLVGGAVGQITSAAFYAIGDTKTPIMLTVLTYTIYIPVKIIVFRHYGLLGLATTASLYFVSNCALQLFVLEKRWRPRRGMYGYLGRTPKRVKP
ncbi:MAG: lipid II flippase MurJ [Pyrinomonadaceae bacterium]